MHPTENYKKKFKNLPIEIYDRYKKKVYWQEFECVCLLCGIDPTGHTDDTLLYDEYEPEDLILRRALGLDLFGEPHEKSQGAYLLKPERLKEREGVFIRPHHFIMWVRTQQRKEFNIPAPLNIMISIDKDLDLTFSWLDDAITCAKPMISPYEYYKRIPHWDISNLNSLLADEAIAAEKSRAAILYKTEKMAKKESALAEYRQNKIKTIGFIGLAAIVLNLILLHFMSWFIIQKPLKKLTLSINRINKGESVTIPYQTRKDQIGILSGALKTFHGVLYRLKDEDLRKIKERQVIRNIIQTMSQMISDTQYKANTMKKESAAQLSTVAENTRLKTTAATASASKTVEQTDSVSSSTLQLQSAVQNISHQISRQTELVVDINDVTLASRKDMEDLTKASVEINEIVSIVKNISKETKLLALNARIEAARSGIVGKGFTVVAREIRDLSIQTENANEEIARKIGSIQKASDIITSRIRRIETRVERLMEASHQISAAVEKQNAATSGIAENVNVTTFEIKTVSEKIDDIRESTRVTNSFAGDVRSYSEEIEAELSTLLAVSRKELSTIGINTLSGDQTSGDNHRIEMKGQPVARQEYLGKMNQDAA